MAEKWGRECQTAVLWAFGGYGVHLMQLRAWSHRNHQSVRQGLEVWVVRILLFPNSETSLAWGRAPWAYARLEMTLDVCRYDRMRIPGNSRWLQPFFLRCHGRSNRNERDISSLHWTSTCFIWTLLRRGDRSLRSSRRGLWDRRFLTMTWSTECIRVRARTKQTPRLRHVECWPLRSGLAITNELSASPRNGLR